MAKFPGVPIDNNEYWCDPRQCVKCNDWYDWCPCNNDCAAKDACDDCQRLIDHKNGICDTNHKYCKYSDWGFICLNCYKLTSDCGCHHCGSEKYIDINAMRSKIYGS